MGLATCLNTTKDISALDSSPAPRCPRIRTIQDLAAGAEQNSNAESTHFRSRQMCSLVTVREHARFFVALGRHYGRNIFWFFRRATPRSSVSFFWRSASFFGPSSFSSLTASTIASSASAFTGLDQMTSPKRSVKEERTRLKEYCESSQDATGFCFTSYRSMVVESISGATLVAGPYVSAMDFTISCEVSPSVEV